VNDIDTSARGESDQLVPGFLLLAGQLGQALASLVEFSPTLGRLGVEGQGKVERLCDGGVSDIVRTRANAAGSENPIEFVGKASDSLGDVLLLVGNNLDFVKPDAQVLGVLREVVRVDITASAGKDLITNDEDGSGLDGSTLGLLLADVELGLGLEGLAALEVLVGTVVGGARNISAAVLDPSGAALGLIF